MSPVAAASTTISISSEEIQATVSTLGAELVSLRSMAAGEVLWRGGNGFWSGQSPLLFPVVGRLVGDVIQVAGSQYPMPIHGFARSSHFDVLSTTKQSCILSLCYSPDTFKQYPFKFRLEVIYKAIGSSVEIEVRISNLNKHDLPFMFGWHPGFIWPLESESGKGDHFIEFPSDEVLEVHAGPRGFLGAQLSPIELTHNRLMLDERLFEHGAMIFPSLASRRVRLAKNSSTRAIEIGFPTMRRLALWSQPGARFVCVEPWLNVPHAEQGTSDFSDSPNVSKLGAGATQTLRSSIELRA